MYQRTLSVPFVPVLNMLLTALFACSLSLVSHGQEAAPAAAPAPTGEFRKPSTPKLKTEKEIAEKKKEKDKARKTDFGPVDEYYKEYLIAMLTQASAESINEARKEIMDDISVVEGVKDVAPTFNAGLINLLKRLFQKDSEGKSFSPATRINAAILLGRLNSKLNKNEAPTPDPAVLPFALAWIDTKEIDGLSSSGMSILARHLKFGAVNDASKKAVIAKLQPYLELGNSPLRSAEARDFLIGQAMECLTLIARSEPKVEAEKETSKQAATLLVPKLVGIIDATESSEWLVEYALLSFGAIKFSDLNADDVAKVEKGIARFVKRSLEDWKQRITDTGATAAGSGSGSGMGGMMGGMGGSGGGGGEVGEGTGSGAGGPPGPPGTGNRPTPKPKPLTNARRIAHQRFERIHFGLSGAYRKPGATDPATNRGLVQYVSDPDKKESLNNLIEKVEMFQTELNDDKAKDLGTLLVAVSKSTKELKKAYKPYLDEKAKVDQDKDKGDDEDEESSGEGEAN